MRYSLHPARNRLLALCLAASLGGCANIPPEAPELSIQLGHRISALEAAHMRLVQEFFPLNASVLTNFYKMFGFPLFRKNFSTTLKSTMFGSRSSNHKIRKIGVNLSPSLVANCKSESTKNAVNYCSPWMR